MSDTTTRRGRITRPELAALYRAGFPVRYIADHFGVGVGAVNSALTRMRRSGWDLPARRAARRAERQCCPTCGRPR